MRSRSLQLVILLVCGCAIIALMHLSFFQNTAERAIRSGVQPFMSGGYFIKTSTSTFFNSQYSNRKAFNDLKSQVQKLQSENAQYQQFAVENETLRKQLDFGSKQKNKPIEASIIGTSDEFGSHELILDRGSRDGVKVGSAVVVDNGIFVGTVSDVKDFVSFLLLPHDDRSSTIISVFKNGKELSGIAHGRFRIGMIIDNVQQAVPLASGDVVVTSVLNNAIPSGLLLGTIREVTSTPNDLFQQATITPAVSYDGLRLVSVVTK